MVTLTPLRPSTCIQLTSKSCWLPSLLFSTWLNPCQRSLEQLQEPPTWPPASLSSEASWLLEVDPSKMQIWSWFSPGTPCCGSHHHTPSPLPGPQGLPPGPGRTGCNVQGWASRTQAAFLPPPTSRSQHHVQAAACWEHTHLSVTLPAALLESSAPATPCSWNFQVLSPGLPAFARAALPRFVPPSCASPPRFVPPTPNVLLGPFPDSALGKGALPSPPGLNERPLGARPGLPPGPFDLSFCLRSHPFLHLSTCHQRGLSEKQL